MRSSAYSADEHISINPLIGIVKDEYVLFGLDMQVDDGWYFYYKNPGDVGIGLSINANCDAKVQWPKYVVKEQTIGDFKIKSNIYDKSVILPIELNKCHDNVSIHVGLAVCNGLLCVPAEKKLNIDIAKPVYDEKIISRITQGN